MTTEKTPDAPRKPGRPRSPDPLVPVTAWVTATTHDRLISVAIKHERSVSSVIREALAQRMPKTSP